MTLWMCGLPGYTALELMDLSFDSGYVTIHNAPTLQKPRSLNFDEIVSLLFGLDLIKESIPSDSELQGKVTELIGRLSAKSPISSKLRATDTVASSLRAQIEMAINSKKSLKIDYHSLYNDKFSNRVITPLELRTESGIEYVFAYCNSATSFRVFRLDRMQNVIAAEIDIEALHGQNVNSNKEIEYVLTISDRSRLMKERFAIEDVGNGQDIQLQSFSEQWIERSIFASSASATLVRPAKIRAEIAKKAKLLLERYQVVRDA